MAKVLVTPPTFGKFSRGMELFAQAGCEVIPPPYPHPLKEKQLIDVIGEVEAAVVGMDEVTENAVEVADRLKVIARHGVGVDTVDIEAATKKGIIVTNVVGANDSSVADLAVGLVLCLARGICRANRSVKEGRWESIVGVELEQKTLGIVGTGKIGRKVIEKIQGFNMNILAYDILPDSTFADKFNVCYVPLEKLLSSSDFVSIHVPLSPETVGFIGEKQLSLMKKSAYLINTARGKVVDEKALYRALKEEKISGAALDVFSQEPPENTDFLNLNNIITIPHMAANTKEAIRRMDLGCVENVIRVLEGKEPVSGVNFPLPKKA